MNDKFKVRFEDDEDEEFPDFIDDDNREPGDWDGEGEGEEGEEGDQFYHGTRVNHGGVCSSTDAAVAVLSAEAREALEVQFEKTMQEYDDDEIGYLSEVKILVKLVNVYHFS